MVNGYCLKEGKHITIKNPEYGVNKINRAIVKGVCPDCGTKVQKLLKKEEIPASLKAQLPAKKGGAKRGNSKKRSSRHKSRSRSRGRK